MNEEKTKELIAGRTVKKLSFEKHICMQQTTLFSNSKPTASEGISLVWKKALFSRWPKQCSNKCLPFLIANIGALKNQTKQSLSYWKAQ